jgi:hypothetical protein
MPLFRTNYTTDDEDMVAYNREQEEALAADVKRIKSLQQVYSNMKFFDMLQVVSEWYNDAVFAERLAAAEAAKSNKNPNTLPKRIINILNNYRLTKFDVEDKDTFIVGTFRTMSTRAGWSSEVTIGEIVKITPNLTVKYRGDTREFPCANVEFFPIKVKEIDGTYNTPLIELVKSGDLNSYCILTGNNPTVLTDKHCNDTRNYKPDDPGLYMMFFLLNDNNYQKILSEMKDVVTDLPDAVKQKTDTRRDAFETAIKRATGNRKGKLVQILNAFSRPPIGSDDVGYHQDEEGEFQKMFKRHGLVGGGGKKLRSAKKTSKRRSVKSKPRYYRRSVGSINHRRKKTTRRRR